MLILLFIAPFLLFYSCGKSKKARVHVYLTDNPANYDKVNIDIRQLFINTADSSGSGWVEIPLNNPGVYNLLDFRNYLDTLLGTIDLPAGKISQMRMVLGPNNSVITGGNTYDLQTPSAQQSGLKFNIHTEMLEGITYHIWIDFDAGNSVVKAGNSGKYLLKPVIRTFTMASGGAIRGVVLPDAANAWIYAIKGADTVASAKPNTGGSFLIRGVPEGTYVLLLDGNNGYKDKSISGVAVTTGKMIDVGTTTLTQ
jgi:hypothetical protein